ncbi:SUN domain-containing protein 1 [Orchesella cincta]|uniref:SUN domain-containing protein 1 n=1 Tax=Orchesella cincta TaxID=48709 RepID=A0A1D2N6Q4_ORCCI|nr:SUN domain-containing protein 1 [Orchesella cincta]
MRINNGVSNSAAKRDFNSSSSSMGTPARRLLAFEATEEIRSVTPQELQVLPPSARRRLMLDEVGRGVNDLRSRRALTPGEKSEVSTHSYSTVHTQSTVSTDPGSGSHVSLNPSLMRRRRETVRRQVLKDDNEPHPYGLQSSDGTPPGIFSALSSSRQSSSVAMKVVQHSETSILRDGTARTVVTERTERAAANGSFRARAEASGQHRASSNNIQTGRTVRFSGDNLPSPYSSDSDTSQKNISFVEQTASDSIFASGARRVKKAVGGFCTYIYLFLVWVVYLEKWCLYDKRRAEENGGVADHREERSAGGWRTYFTSSSASSATNSQSPDVSKWRSFFYTHNSSMSQSSTASSSPLGRSFLGYLAVKYDPNYEMVKQAGGNLLYDRSIHNKEIMFAKIWRACKILFRLFLVILALAVLYWLALAYGESVWEGVKWGSYAVMSSLSSVLTSGAGLIVSTFNFPAADVSHVPEKQPIIAAPIPSSVKILQQTHTETVTIKSEFDPEALATIKSDLAAIVANQAAIESNQAAVKSNQDAISHLKLEMGNVKSTLNDHASRLTSHSNRFKSMETEISVIMAAMNAASAKEKSVEQIIEEVLTVSVGENTDGTPVSLKSIFSVLQEKIERERISHEIQIKLQYLAEGLGKVEQNFQGVDDDMGAMKADLSMLGADVKKMEAVLAERPNTKVEIDSKKIEEIMLPLLISEIEKQVTISCNSKKCPEGHPFAGLLKEDIELMIRRAIGKYDADKTGLPDLALESAGGSILSTRCTKSSELRNSVISYWGFRLWSPPNTPRTIIQPGVAPGECWAFEGSVGDVVIKLAVSSIVTGFTLEHIPKTISRYGHIDSAPKNFQVLGLMHEHDTEEVHDYGSFTYEDNDEPLQYFAVSNATTKAYPIVELKVLSNHGNMKHTCIYRFRVHGAVDLSRSHLKSIEEENKDPSRK